MFIFAWKWHSRNWTSPLIIICSQATMLSEIRLRLPSPRILSLLRIHLGKKVKDNACVAAIDRREAPSFAASIPASTRAAR